MVLIYVSAAWALGIYMSSRSDLPVAMWGAAALLCVGIAWLWRRAPRTRLAALCGIFVCLGAMRYAIAQPRFDEGSVATYNDRGWMTLTGVVVAEPDVRDSYTNLRMRAETLAVGGENPIGVAGAVLIRAPRYPALFYGDRLRVRGQLETPPVFESFSYRDYLARKGIYSQVRWARVTILARGEGRSLLGALLAFKRQTQSVIAQVLPEPSAALLTGILLGVETGIPQDLVADFSTTGTSHIIAISGFNLAIIGNLFSRLSVRLVGRRYAAWFSTAAIALYTLFVGGSAAVVRAAVMSCIAVWGEHWGRRNSSANALSGTALIMTAWNPHTLWDLGFLLSFAATMGLVTLSDPLQRRCEELLARLLPAGWVEWASNLANEALVLTTCAQLTTLPIILYNFRTLSLVTLLSNALILPAQQQVMLWGAAATIGGLLWLPLGRVLGWVAWLFLAYTIYVVEWSARLPRAAIEVGPVGPIVVWAWYALLGASGWWMVQTHERRRALWARLRVALAGQLVAKVLIGGMAVAAALVWAASFALPDRRLHVTVLDVGQGDAATIETPSGRQVVVNGGPSATRMTAHLGRRMPFWDRTLDVVVLTDLGDEHLAGLVPVLERYEVGHVVYLPPRGEASPTYERWHAVVQEKGIPVLVPHAGLEIDLGDGVVVTVLHPTGASPDEGDPAVVLRVAYGETCALFASSAGREAETAMLARGESLRCDVLLVGRHGSAGATSAGFLEAVRPALAVISTGEGNRSGDPDEGTLAQLGESGTMVLRTDLHGSVEVISDGRGYEARVGR